VQKIKRYPNGEPITKKKEADEPWAIDHAILMELWTDTDDIESLRKDFLRYYKRLHGKIYPNEEQLLRWCVQINERMTRFTYCEKKKDACNEVKEHIALKKSEERARSSTE
jgi:hypothetical protein